MLTNVIVNAINRKTKSIGQSLLFRDSFFILGPELYKL